MLYLCTHLKQVRAFSSVGLEHLPYKQRVGGSTPSTPTSMRVYQIEKYLIHPLSILFGL